MKKTKLKILFTSLSFFALSATFGQVDTSKATPTDSINVLVPQASPMVTDSTSADQSTLSTDSTSAESKAMKKREKAAKKEAKAEKKEAKQ